MMGSGDLHHMFYQRDILQNFRTNNCMLFDYCIFLIRQSGRFVQNCIRNTYVSNIMQMRSIAKVENIFLLPSKLLCDQCRIFRHTMRMSTGVFIFRLNGCYQCLDHLQRHGFHLLSALSYFLLLTCALQIPDLTDGSDQIYKKQHQHSNSNENS